MVAKHFGKRKLNSPNEVFNELINEADKLLKKHNKWIIIGHSFREDDKKFLKLLKNNCSGKEIDIISKNDDQIETKSKNYLLNANIKYYNCGLINYINNNKKKKKRKI